MAEGQGPIFADKLRFFRTAPFREMEKFSRAHVPDVPATEFLPHRPVPATTDAYVGEHIDAAKPVELPVGPKKAAKLPVRRSLASSVAAGEIEGQASVPTVGRASVRPRSGSATPSSLDADFVKAARRLKSLATGTVKPRKPRGKSGNWGEIFDATVPDEIEITQNEAG